VLASVFGYVARDVVAGTAMGVLAGTWLSIGLVTLTGKPGATSDPLGVLLLLAAVAMTIPATAAAAGRVVPALVLTTTALRFATTGLFQITAASTWKDVAGIVGLVLCGLAVYAAAAMAIEDARGETVLPLGRRGAGATSLGAPFAEQLGRLEHEAGVREQL
jgi:succinate-acetate transporter protein